MCVCVCVCWRAWTSSFRSTIVVVYPDLDAESLECVCLCVCVCVCVCVCIHYIILWWAVTSPRRLPSHASETRRWVGVYSARLRWEPVFLRQRAVTLCHASAKRQKEEWICPILDITRWHHSVGATFWVELHELSGVFSYFGPRHVGVLFWI